MEISHSKVLKYFLVGCSALAMHSCVLYKPYKRPCLEIPDAWRLPVDETSPEINVRWWELWNDPILNALIQEALESNKDIKLAIARVDEFRAQLGIVSSQLFPQIFGQATAVRQRTSQTLAGESFSSSSTDGGVAPLIPFGGISPFANDFRLTLTAAYQLDLWGKLQSATDAAYAKLLAQIENRRTVVLSVVSSLANAYVVLRQYDYQLEISLKTLNSRIQSYELAKIRFQEGLTSELEVKQAASEVDEAQIQVIQFNNLIPQQENLISILIGHPPTAIRRGDTIEEWSFPPEIPAGIPSDILDQRPDVKQAEELLIASNALVGEARALFFPDITLTGYYGTESGQLRNLFTDPSKVWQFAGNLLQPIFEGGRLISTLDLAKSVKREAYFNYQQTILTAFKDVNNALVAHQQAKKGVVAELQRVKDLTDYLKLATLQYENGLVDYLNVLDAERRLFAAQLDLAQAQAFVYTTLIAIYQALGGGWVIDADYTALLNPC